MTTQISNPYDSTSRRLHWLTAALVALLWTLGQCIDFFPSGTPRISARSLHVCTGIVLAMVLAMRLGWLKNAGRVAPPPQGDALAGIARWTHVALYGLLVLVVVLGLFNTWQRGDSIFGLFRIPAMIPGDKGLRELLEELHGWAANALIGLAGLHALVGLFHHLVLRDDVLRRMTGR